MTVVGTLGGGFRVVKVIVGVVAFVGSVTSAAVPTRATSPRTHQDDLTGKWRLTLEMEVGRATPLLELVQKDGTLTGTYTGRYGTSPVEGRIEGRAVAFTVALETTALVFEGEVAADGTLAGTATFGELGQVVWTAAREKTD